MTKLFGVFLVGVGLLAGCAMTKATQVRPPPVLGKVSEKSLDVEFKGGEYDPTHLFVCGTLAEGKLTCIPWEIFMEQMQAPRPTDYPI